MLKIFTCERDAVLGGVGSAALINVKNKGGGGGGGLVRSSRCVTVPRHREQSIESAVYENRSG